MKKVFLLLTVFLLPFFVIAQRPISKDSLLNLLVDSIKKFEDQYNCNSGKKVENRAGKPSKIVSESSFDSVYKKASLRILTSSQDLIKNGKAVALDFNEALKKFGINYNWSGRNKNIWNAGFSAEDAGSSTFHIFSKDSWKEGFSFNVGQAIPLFKKTILFLTSDCDSLSKARNVFYAQLLKKYEKVLNTDPATIKDIEGRIAALKGFDIQSANGYNTIPSVVTDDEIKLVKEYQRLDSFIKFSQTRNNFLVLYDQPVRDFEVANLTNFGYRVHWFNWNISPGIRRFTVYDTAVVRLAKISKKGLVRIAATGTYNFFRESAHKRITYFSFEVSAGNTNYLEEILPTEISDLKDTLGNISLKKDNSALVLKDYDKLRQNYGFAGLGFVYNYFPAQLPFFKKMKRFVGFEFAGSTKVKFLEPSTVTARDLFSVRGGLLFTFESNSIAKTTIGIIASLTDVPYNDLTSKDRFTVGIRIGVPFNY